MYTERDGCSSDSVGWPIEADWQHSLHEVSLVRFRAPQTKAKLDRSMTDFRFSNNRIMAVSKSANGSGVDLMLAFERAAEQRGTKAYFHEWEAQH